MAPQPSFYEKLADWLVPLLLAAAVYSIQGLRADLSALQVTVAVVADEIRDYGRRIDELEGATWRR